MATLHATTLPSDRAGSGWYELLPPARPYPQLEGEQVADWVIVGAGFTGLSAALRLARARKGERIVVLDAQRVAWGASGRNSGFMIDLPHELNSENYTGAFDKDRKLIGQNRAAIAFAEGAAAEFDLEDHLSPIGRLHGAASAGGLRALNAFARHLTALGEPYTALGAEDMRRNTGTDYYLGGLHTPGTLLIQPAGYVRGLARGLADRYGVEIFEHSPLLSLEPEAPASPGAASNAHRIRTPEGAVVAPRIILAINGHVESIGLFRHRLMHVFTYASMTRRLDDAEQRRIGGESEWGLTPADPMGTTVRRLRCGRIMMRNVVSWNPGRAASEAQVWRAGRQHDRSFKARFPMLRGVEMEYRWGGHLCLSKNSAPAFGEIEPGLFVAACQNGLGATKGTLSGMLAADLACAHDSDLLRQWQAQPQPCQLPPEPLLSLGARACLWWRHRRASREL